MRRPVLIYDRAAVPRLRVFIADDHPLFREGLVRASRARAPRWSSPARRPTGARRSTRSSASCRMSPLVDLRLPGLDGIGVARAVAARGPRHPRRDHLGLRRRRARVVGARGRSRRLPDEGRAPRGDHRRRARGRPRRDRAGTLARRHAGGRGAPARRRPGADDARAGGPRRPRAGALRARDRRELVLSTATVKTHLQHLYEKLGVSDRAAAVAEAMRRGLIE